MLNFSLPKTDSATSPPTDFQSIIHFLTALPCKLLHMEIFSNVQVFSSNSKNRSKVGSNYASFAKNIKNCLYYWDIPMWVLSTRVNQAQMAILKLQLYIYQNFPCYPCNLKPSMNGIEKLIRFLELLSHRNSHSQIL